MEKQKTTVRVAGKEYTLVSSDSPEYMKSVAGNVNRQISELVAAARMSANDAAVLTAINLADELMKSRKEANHLRKELEETRQVLMEMRAGLEQGLEGGK